MIRSGADDTLGPERPFLSSARDVRRARPDDVASLVEVLAQAFDDDPVPQWLFRGDRRRRRGLRRFFGIQVRHMVNATGDVWTTEDRVGAAMWAPPDASRPGWGDLARLLPVVPYLTGLGRDGPEAVRLLTAVDGARPRQRHWYLATIGTAPDQQRTGVGSALMRAVLDRVDQEALPVYLESSKESNLPFYGAHGFDVTGEITAARGGPTLWNMWRPARPPAA